MNLMWEWLTQMALEHGTIFTILIAAAVTLTMTLMRVKLIDQEKISAWQREVSRWEAERERAKKTGDKKLMAKVKKQELHINQLKSRLASQMGKSLIIMFIPIIILMLLWPVLIGFYGNDPVAFVPGLPWSGDIEIPFWIWYMVCSYFVSTVTSKIFGTAAGMGKQAGRAGQPSGGRKKRAGSR